MKNKKGMCPECKKAYEEGVRAEGRHIRKRNKKFSKVLGEYDRGELRSGSKKGPKVKSRKQALAIAYSELKKKKKKKKK